MMLDELAIHLAKQRRKQMQTVMKEYGTEEEILNNGLKTSENGGESSSVSDNQIFNGDPIVNYDCDSNENIGTYEEEKIEENLEEKDAKVKLTRAIQENHAKNNDIEKSLDLKA